MWEKKYALASLMKGLASLMFAILGFLCKGSSIDQHFAQLVAIGLILGAVSIMAAVAVVNLITVPGSTMNTLFAIGAVSFLVSDVVMILNSFGKQERFSLRITNLGLYYLGQLLIAISLLYA